MKNNTLTRSVFKGSLIIIIFSLLTSPLGYFVRMIFSRSLSIGDYGLIYAVLSFYGVFTIVNDLGFGYATTYFLPKYYQEKKYDLCWLLYKYDQFIELGTSIVLSVSFILLSDFLSLHFFKHDGAKELIYLFSLYLIANGLISSIQNFLIGMQKDIYYSGIEFLRLSFTLLFSLIFFLFDVVNIVYFAMAFVFAYFLVVIIYLYIINNKFGMMKTSLIWKPNLFSTTIKYALPTFITNSLYVFISNIDILFLTYFQNVESVGIYNISFPIVSVSILIFQPIQRLILPLVSKLFSNDKQKLEVLIKQLLKLVPFVGVYFSLFMFMFSKGLISMIFGYKYVAQADLPLKIMAIAYSIVLLNIYLTSVVAGLGEVKKRLKVAVILLVLSVVSGIIGAKFFGITGVILANSLVFSVSIILLLNIIKEQILISIPFAFYFKLIIFSLIVIGVRSRFAYNPIAIFEILTLGIVYTIFMLIIAIKWKVVDKSIIVMIINHKFLSNKLTSKLTQFFTS